MGVEAKAKRFAFEHPRKRITTIRFYETSTNKNQFEIPEAFADRIKDNLAGIYGEERVSEVYDKLVDVATKFKQKEPTWLKNKNERAKREGKITERDALFITYADSIVNHERGTPLQALNRFANNYLGDKSIHILPFYPWDTDKGFSVKNYNEVDNRNGSWKDIHELRKDFDLMFDAVINHASIDNPFVQNALIQRALEKTGNPDERDYREYKDFAIAFSNDDRPEEELLKRTVSRPREASVLTKYFVYKDDRDEIDGKEKYTASFEEQQDKEPIDEGWAWTTFSRIPSSETRQVDLNYANSEVLVKIAETLLFYVQQGAGLLRIDALGYLWKELGKKSLHEEKTHKIMEVLGNLLEATVPGVVTISEVNEAQDNAVKYVSKGDKLKADMMYQFAPYPLAVHGLLKETSKYIMQEVEKSAVADGKQLIIVAGSHDGIGENPLRSANPDAGPLLPEAEIKKMNAVLEAKHGALPNKGRRNGEEVVYEECVTPWSAVNPENSTEPLDIQVKRYLALISTNLFAFRGMPAISINGLLGEPNNDDELDENRTINRKQLKEEDIEEQLNDPESRMSKVYSGVTRLMNLRASEKAFHPLGPAAKAVPLSDKVVSALMESPDEKDRILTMVNVSTEPVVITLDSQMLEDLGITSAELPDLISGFTFTRNSDESITVLMDPHQSLLLKDSEELS